MANVWINPEPFIPAEPPKMKEPKAKGGGKEMSLTKHGDRRSAPQPERKTSSKAENQDLTDELNDEDDE